MKIKLFSLIAGLIILIITISSSYSHTDHYKNLKKIEMDVYKDGKIIGFSNYEFISKFDELLVKNITKFKVKLLGVEVFSISSQSEERYKNGNLMYFKSSTVQNKKKKFEFIIDNWGIDFQSEHERYLVEQHFQSPVIIYDYPSKIKAF